MSATITVVSILKSVKSLFDMGSIHNVDHVMSLIKDINLEELKLLDEKFKAVEAQAAANPFKFTNLPVGENKLTTHSQLSVALQGRLHANAMLAQDGVALRFSYQGTRVKLLAEDLKGRTHPIALWHYGHDKQDVYSSQFKNIANQDLSKTMSVDLQEGRTDDYLHGAHIRAKMEKLSDRVMLVVHNPLKAAELNDLWFCKPDGLIHGSRKGVIPILTGSYHPSVHAQLNKIDRSIIPYIANGTKKGPTYNTLYKKLSDVYKISQDASPTLFTDRLAQIFADLGEKVDIKADNWKKSSRPDLRKHAHLYIPTLISEALSTDVGFDPTASFNKTHKKVGFPSIKSDIPNLQIDSPVVKRAVPPTHTTTEFTQRKQSSSNVKKAVSLPPEEHKLIDIDELKEVFLNFRETIPLKQLANKLIQTLAQGELLPLAMDDIKSINGIVETMDRQPNLSENGLNWIIELVNEKKLMLRNDDIIPAEKPEGRRRSL
jgi:hypothetical protein